MSNSEPQNEATSSTELEEIITPLSEKDGLETIAVAKDSLREGGAIVMKVYGETNEETNISNELEVELAGEVRQLMIQLDPWGAGSRFEVPVYIEDELAVEDGEEFLQQYAQDPTEANLYKLVTSNG
ncbi:hypothetical protein EFA46_009095 [Halarchaeum sp. CBA1220]|uniref:hypothetical protein n=1 Tax=Halarchaeum sp. CBA1220 TaxID=1853682 RepID=UPI000F3A9710|nr:hypothetical protein [Halarchaeum sp. CBA1220]QLC34356.1 hypothetical protein EFA46_009095 [Halarchaeum sp. CBA1220]